MKEINIKLNGTQAGLIIGAVLVEACAVGKLLSKLRKETKRADDAESKTWMQGMIMQLQEIQIKGLRKEIEQNKTKS